MLEKFLQEIGLSEKESEIYLKLQSVSEATVTELSRMTNINRTTLYPILNHLITKGLVSEVEKGKKARFQAEPPERLATYIQNEKTRLEEQEKLLDDIIPRLKSVSLQSGEKPIVKVFEGREGILRSVQETFESGDGDDVAYLIYPKDKLHEFFSEKEIKNARSLRLSKKIKSVSIYTTDGQESESDEFSNRHKVNKAEYPILCDITIHADKIRIHTLGEDLSAIFIKSKDVADTLKTLFRLAIKGVEK